MLYTVTITPLRGDLIKFGMFGTNDTIVAKVEKILQDCGGGTAEVTGENFYTIVDA